MSNETPSEKKNNYTTDYLQELFQDKKSIQSSGLTFKHVNHLLDKGSNIFMKCKINDFETEIALVKEHLFKLKETV